MLCVIVIKNKLGKDMSISMGERPSRFGQLASEGGYHLPNQVLQSAAGFYIGTADNEGPVSRESEEYFPTQEAAETALKNGNWIQRLYQ